MKSLEDEIYSEMKDYCMNMLRLRAEVQLVLPGVVGEIASGNVGESRNKLLEIETYLGILEDEITDIDSLISRLSDSAKKEKDMEMTLDMWKNVKEEMYEMSKINKEVLDLIDKLT